MAGRASRAKQLLPEPEELLLDYAQRLKKHLPGRRAVHCHLSQLMAHNKGERHMRLAASIFEDLVNKHEGQCFCLRNGDLVVVVKGVTVAQLDRPVLKLQYLFSEDPLMQQDPSAETHVFCTWYDLEKDYRDFLQTAQLMYSGVGVPAVAKPTSGETGTAAAEELRGAGRPLTPEQLGKLETALNNTDVIPLLRQQPVCAITRDKPPTPVFRETYVSIDALRQQMLPDYDLLSNRWLFQYLTEILDQRVLAALPSFIADPTEAISININVATILSDGFITFQQSTRHKSMSVVLELRTADIFGDMTRFMFARDHARQQGFKLCVDGHSHISFPMLRRDDLGVDLEKVFWSPDLSGKLRASQRERFNEAVSQAGPARVILCRCDDEAAIDYGLSLGISLFQGRYVDTLLG